MEQQKAELKVRAFKKMLHKRRKANPEKQAFDLSEFEIGLEIGKGAFGKIRRVIHRETKAVLALKSYDKHRLLGAEEMVENEIKSLS